MSNVCDYIKWRGDITLAQSEFNHIDNLVLSRFSYFPFDTLIKENEIVTIKELSERFKKQDKDKMQILWKYDADLFPLMGESKRFGEMKATKFVNILDENIEKQFSAITILLPDNTIFVAYRGTDDTMVGWKEDFNLSFQSHTPSQISGKNYLEDVAKKHPFKKLRIGGHSKGGNIAIYSAAFANQKVKNRIINVYNNDGPGFCEDIINSPEYQEILPKVHTFIPQSSVIGRLMNHKENYTIVESTQEGLMQHDLYSWQIVGNDFVTVPKATAESNYIDKTITEWVDGIEPEKRKEFIDAVYQILKETNAQTLSELKASWLTYANTKKMLKSYKSFDEETKKIIWHTVTALLKSMKDNSKERKGKKTRIKKKIK